jgi:2-keto-4-pentenoate hydratase/2-oxohepta-3-ene-1,7-dioic acid hydratase in catechol pathway
MKLTTYQHQSNISIGKVEGDQVIDLPRNDPALPATMMELLRAGPDAMVRARAVRGDHAVALSEVTLLAPLPNPSKFLAIGMNYRKHVAEAAKIGVQTPPTQVWFNKQVSCINGPFGDVHLPAVSNQLDYEVEGTPSGVGVAMSPPVYLRAGDVMRAEIEGIGAIENRVIAEPV